MFSAISLMSPLRVTWSIITMTLPAPWTRSIAPPMPLTIAPGIIQLERSPDCDTCIAPSTATSTFPPRIIANESEEPKNAAPGAAVMVSLPALIISGSSCSRVGYGPTPRMPFSECSVTWTLSGR